MEKLVGKVYGKNRLMKIVESRAICKCLVCYCTRVFFRHRINTRKGVREKFQWVNKIQLKTQKLRVGLLKFEQHPFRKYESEYTRVLETNNTIIKTSSVSPSDSIA